MVARKAVAPAGDTATASASASAAPRNAPPYPTTPTAAEPQMASSVCSGAPNTSPPFDPLQLDQPHEAPSPKRRDSDVSSHGTWDSHGSSPGRPAEDDEQHDFVEVPRPLSFRPSQPHITAAAQRESELPAILRPGPAAGTGTKLESNNPYKQNGPAPPAELPAVSSPTEEPAQLQPEYRPLAPPSHETAETLSVPPPGQPPPGQPPPAPAPRPPVSHTSQALHSSNPWAHDPSQQPPPPRKEALSPAPPEQRQSTAPYPEDDDPPPPASPPQFREQHHYAPPPGPPPIQSVGPPPDHAEPTASQQPPPMAKHIRAMTSQESVPETPGTRDRRQRSEHYQIKHVNWLEHGKMRQAPVLTQNANGPCPLLALVNALVLTTPANLDTPLIEALRTREQVSLGLLLDAVFDELMSGRRGKTAHQLPDVGELYAFLLTLHTGMNVNPRFVAPAQMPREAYGDPAAMNRIHPHERAQSQPGCFEETSGMRLYSTFNIPLLHGWTAPKGTPAYNAFERSAPTYDDATNIQFAEAELEDKLRTEGLSFQEQQTLEDIQTIKSFLLTWPTQLTDHGLETISQSLLPGQTAILFRNDHFSTLYKEPRHGALMTLVTDAGYSSHAEIVWESLVDVNGAASEYFSGDFRSVSHGQGQERLNQGNSGGGNSEVPTPLPGPQPHSVTSSQAPIEDPGASATGAGQRSASEQEDHDLALALQLQEEEEDQQRQYEARRRREQELSEQFLSSQTGGEQPPPIPPRRNQRSPRGSNANIPSSQRLSGNSGHRPNTPQVRPAVHRPGQSADPDAPPSYEQSANDRPYRPAGATAPPTQGNPLNTLDHLRRQSSAYAQQSSTSVNSVSGHGRRTSQGGSRIQRRQSQLGPAGPPSGPAPPYGRVHGVPGAANIKDTEDRCTIM